MSLKETLCSLGDIGGHFGGTFYLHPQSILFFISVNFYHLRGHIAEGDSLGNGLYPSDL